MAGDDENMIGQPACVEVFQARERMRADSGQECYENLWTAGESTAGPARRRAADTANDQTTPPPPRGSGTRRATLVVGLLAIAVPAERSGWQVYDRDRVDDAEAVALEIPDAGDRAFIGEAC
ncbi:hypothetical protein [Nocardia salmonicida]|uniref:hypothetical protein n=1 Tax=Nocardia salmonicida TaxID=53431 RepID=UPI000B2008A5|nr:hypothetical protein [Nocardia salmonicida]